LAADGGLPSAVLAYLPEALPTVAVVVRVGAPLATPAGPLLTKPVTASVKAGLAAP
jgi:hypothetical protein